LPIAYGNIPEDKPCVYWTAENERAEITLRTFELNSGTRTQLIARKIEKIEEVANLYERFVSAGNQTLARLLHKRLVEMSGPTSEYSGMVATFFEKKDSRPLIEWLRV
jgi:hypothetical protein